MPAFNFKEQFAGDVAAGIKCQTVRAIRKVFPKVGDTAYCFTGMRTKHCRRLGAWPITAVEPFDLDAMQLWKETDRDAFARADGFGDWPEMLRWFISTHGYPFVGVTIKWLNKDSATPVR